MSRNRFPGDSLANRFKIAPETLEIEDSVLALRREGKSYRQISDELGLSGKGQAYKICHRALKRWTAEIGPELREMERMRLDELQAAVWPMAVEGDLKAVDSVLKIMERRARMFGLDHSDKVAAAKLRIEADKLRVMAIAIGRALDAVGLDEAAKEKASEVMFTQMKELASRG